MLPYFWLQRCTKRCTRIQQHKLILLFYENAVHILWNRKLDDSHQEQWGQGDYQQRMSCSEPSRWCLGATAILPGVALLSRRAGHRNPSIQSGTWETAHRVRWAMPWPQKLEIEERMSPLLRGQLHSLYRIV